MNFKNLLFTLGFIVCLSLQSRADTEPANDTYLGADPIAENGSVMGTIAMPTTDLEDWYKFTTTSDGDITISFTCLPSSSYNRIYLYDSDGGTSLGSADGSGGATFTKTGLAAGTYYIRYYYYSTAYASSYTLSNTVTPTNYTNDAEPNDSYATALTNLNENDSVYGHIGHRLNGGSYDTEDWYQFTTTEDGNISLELTNTTGEYFRIYLYDNDGVTSLGSTDAYSNATVTKTGLVAGTYYARVYYYSTAYFSGYKLKATVAPTNYENDIEPNDTYLTALTNLNENDSVYGHIGHRLNGGAYDIEDWYRFTTTNDGDVTLQLTNETGQYFRIYLYDADGGTSLGSTDAYSNAIITKGGLAAGTYYARVYYYSPAYFSGYKLKTITTTDGHANDAEPDNTPAEALPAMIGETVQGHIGFRLNGGDYDMDDWYQFTTTENGNISLTMATPVDKYNRIYIYDADGITSLGSTDGYGSKTVTKNGLAAGTYYARVYYYSSTYFTGYDLTFSLDNADYASDAEDNGSIATATSVQTNETIYGNIGYRYNGGTYDIEDYYQIDIHSPGDITLNLANDMSAYNRIYLYNSAGSSLGSAEGTGGASKTYTDLDAGTYYARVYYYSSTYFSAYSLTNTYCPDAITITADNALSFCHGGYVTFSTDDHHLNYLWSDGATTETDHVTETGDYSLTIDNGGGCVRTSNTISTDVIPTPVAVITNDGPLEFCAGSSVNLGTTVTPDSYLWSTGATTPTINVTTTGDYFVDVTKNGCSASSAIVHVTVNANPAPSISADGPVTFCDGGSVTLTSSAAASYAWSDGSTGASVTADADGSYFVTVTDDNGCTGTSATTVITENANPVAGIIADGPTEFCSGGSVNLTASGGTDYLWSNGATTASINVTASGDYSCTVTNAAGCSDITSVITVNVTACGSVSIIAEGPTTFCEGGSVVLTSSEAEGNLWSTGETTQSITVSESGDYYCENGINTSNTITVTVNANPDATIDADGDTEFCDGGSVNISAVAGYDTYLWSDGSSESSVSVSESGSYQVTVTDNGCSAVSSTIDVIVNDNPEPSIEAEGPTTFCSGSVNLTVTGSYASYLWSNGETTATINVSEAGSYYCTVTNASGCEGTSNTIEVSTGTAPTVSISITGSNVICYGGSLEIDATASTGNLQWYMDGSPMSGETGSVLFVTLPGKYTCVATDGSCSTTSNEMRVKAAKKIALSPAGPYSICPGGSTSFSVPLLPGATYQWYKGMTLLSGATSNTYEATAGGNYHCIITYAGCLRSSDHALVSVGCKEGVFAEAQMDVYPNPAAENFTISYTATVSGDAVMMITDITGRVISQQNISLETGINTMDYNTDAMPSGLYLITITDAANQSAQLKLVIEK